MANQKEQLIAKLATGTFSDEVLEQAMLALTQKTQPLSQAPSGFLSEAEARKFCGDISRSTLWIWRRQGLRALCEGLVDQLPAELDRDRARLWLLGGKTPEGIEVKGTYGNFTRNAIGDIEDIGGLAPLDYLVAMSNALGYKKPSTPGSASPGNAALNASGANANYEAAKQAGDVMGLIQNAPPAKISI